MPAILSPRRPTAWSNPDHCPGRKTLSRCRSGGHHDHSEESYHRHRDSQMYGHQICVELSLHHEARPKPGHLSWRQPRLRV